MIGVLSAPPMIPRTMKAVSAAKLLLIHPGIKVAKSMVNAIGTLITRPTRKTNNNAVSISSSPF